MGFHCDFRLMFITLSLSLISGCDKQTTLALCPNLATIGKGSFEYEDADRCVRVMAARYTISGQSPADIATAAIEFCRESKYEPLVHGASAEAADKLWDQMAIRFRAAAVRTVVEMRSAKCVAKPDLFKHVNDPIDRPKIS